MADGPVWCPWLTLSAAASSRATAGPPGYGWPRADARGRGCQAPPSRRRGRAPEPRATGPRARSRAHRSARARRAAASCRTDRRRAGSASLWRVCNTAPRAATYGCRSSPLGPSCVPARAGSSRGLYGDVDQCQRQPLDLGHERNRASRAGQACQPHESAVLGMTARGRGRGGDVADRLDGFERFDQLSDRDAEAPALGLPSRGLHEVARAQTEPQPRGNGELIEPPLEPRGVIVRRDGRVELLLCVARRAAPLEIDAQRLHPALEVLVVLGRQPLVREPHLELLRAAELAEDQVQLAYDQLEQFDLLVEQLADVRIDGDGGGPVHDVD